MKFLDVDLLELGFALLLVIAVIAVPLAILITLVLIRLFRRRVAQSMRATAGTPAEPRMRVGSNLNI
jgi:hypothetical protein